MRKLFAILLIALSCFAFVSCESSKYDNYYIGDLNVAAYFSSYPKPQEIFDKAAKILDDYQFNTEGLTYSSDEDMTKYYDENNNLIYDISNYGYTINFHTVDIDNNPVTIEKYNDDDNNSCESVFGVNYKIINRKEITIYGNDREMIYYVLDDGIWNMSEATYYDDKGMETYFFESNRLFAEVSSEETVTLDKVLKDENINAVEFKLGEHKFSVVEGDNKHVLYLTSDFYAVFDDELLAKTFAETYHLNVEEWKDGYFTICFENETLRLDEECENLDYNSPEEGQSYFRTVVLDDNGDIIDFNFDGPTLIK